MKAKWVGFEILDAFVVGYGIDYAQRNRNLPTSARCASSTDAPAIAGTPSML